MSMNAEAIYKTAQRLKDEANAVPDPSMQNYHEVLAEYKRILNDLCVLVRELAGLSVSVSVTPNEKV